MKLLCRRHGVGEASYYQGRSKSGVMSAFEARHLRELEAGKAR